MLLLKIPSRLLCYPTPELQAALSDIPILLTNSQQHKALQPLITELHHTDLLELQQRYVTQFDRGRYLSLHLFEHIHGESRDRGQAMVDLVSFYAAHGYELDAKELPDYLPLFLEFLAELPETEAIAQLQDITPILALLGARLSERQASYAAIFSVLTELAGAASAVDSVRASVASEGEDSTLVNMDAIWEEEAVSFMANPNTCNATTNNEQPLHFQRPTPSTAVVA